jgi:hypothetical protein
MILTLDNLDGLGPVDYSTAIDRSKVLTITRSLNAPSILEGLLCLEGSALKLPVRQARVTATAQAGAVLFTGYLTVEPVAIYAGAASAGPVYRYVLSAVSDEWLLDKQSAGSLLGAAFAQAAGVLLRQLVSRLAPGLLRTAAVPAGRQLGAFQPAAGAATWSAHAGALAAAGYAAYRALGGALTLTSAGTQVHPLADGDGTLSIAALQQAAVKELANDISLSGALEPAAYWTELFLGDAQHQSVGAHRPRLPPFAVRRHNLRRRTHVERRQRP